MFNIGTKLYHFFYCKLIGKDIYGNCYYQSRKKNHLGKYKRSVMYNGIIEASKVPPMWHGWLRYAINEVPNREDVMHSWQVEYKPNFTGTKLSYHPMISQDQCFAPQEQRKRYEAWKP